MIPRSIVVTVCAQVLAAAAGAEPQDSTRTGEREWGFAAGAAAYIMPGSSDFVLPILAADRRALHLELRHNYEDLETSSIFLGGTVSGGGELEWWIRPMLGAIFGRTDGVAPALVLGLSWKRLALYSENEYVFDSSDDGVDFYYNWSELTVFPLDRLEAGLATQRLQASETGMELERGALLRLYWDVLSLTGYCFDPFSDSEFWVVTVAAEF